VFNTYCFHTNNAKEDTYKVDATYATTGAFSAYVNDHNWCATSLPHEIQGLHPSYPPRWLPPVLPAPHPLTVAPCIWVTLRARWVCLQCACQLLLGVVAASTSLPVASAAAAAESSSPFPLPAAAAATAPLSPAGASPNPNPNPNPELSIAIVRL
jgi:hypothetical protein